MKWKTKSQAPFDFLGVLGWISEQNKKWNTDSIININLKYLLGTEKPLQIMLLTQFFKHIGCEGSILVPFEKRKVPL